MNVLENSATQTAVNYNKQVELNHGFVVSDKRKNIFMLTLKGANKCNIDHTTSRILPN